MVLNGAISKLLVILMVLIIVAEVFLNTDSINSSDLIVQSVMLLNIVVCLLPLAWRNWPKYSLLGIHVIFFCLFMGIFPLIQLRGVGFPWGLFSHFDTKFEAALIVLIWNVSFVLAYFFPIRTYRGDSVKRQNNDASDSSIWTLMLMSLIAVLVYGFVYGWGNLMLRNKVLDRDVIKSGGLLLDSLCKGVPVSCFALFLLSKKHGWRNYMCGAVLLVFVLLVASPLANARFYTAAVYIGFLLIALPSLFGVFRFFAFFFLSFVFAFGFLDQFRGDWLEDGLRFSVLDFDAVKEGHYDAFAMIGAGVRSVELSGITWGNQLLGSIFFMVPRAIWESKAIGTGAMIAHDVGLNFDNLSAPLPVEGYANFGIFGVILFAVIIANVVRWLDDSYWCDISASGFLYSIYPFLLGFLFFSLRGDLMNGIAYTSGFAFSFYLAFKISKTRKYVGA